MTGFNLPPGVSTSMLPGNSKAEQDAEAFSEAMWEILPDSLTEDQKNAIIEWTYTKIGESYGAGYQEALYDEAQARAQAAKGTYTCEGGRIIHRNGEPLFSIGALKEGRSGRLLGFEHYADLDDMAKDVAAALNKVVP